ncbi:MAG: hypothetical protein E7G96_02700 [Serratia liquefaciens]|nr:hypothetical protein [Serratia liquefaciens]
MQKFDRELQRHILQGCINSYPRQASYNSFDPTKIMAADNEDEMKLAANIIYLSEHGLIKIIQQTNDDPWNLIDNIVATKDGVDFMQQDGGLSAILNVQTIKLHRETIVVLEDLIAISNMSEGEKEKAKSTLSELSAEALKAVVQTVTTAGLAGLLK